MTQLTNLPPCDICGGELRDDGVSGVQPHTEEHLLTCKPGGTIHQFYYDIRTGKLRRRPDCE